MTDSERLLLEVLGQQLDVQREIIDELRALRQQAWQCSCGHLNALQSIVCARRARRPGEAR